VSVAGDEAISQVKLNVAYDGKPVVITGPLPARGEKAKEVGGRVVIMSIQKDLVEVDKPSDETPVPNDDACKCTGGPSAAVPMGANNVQYPMSYGDFCSTWSPRDPEAAAAAEGNQAELTYLGDGWAYNSVSKMRVYVYSDVDPTKQTIGEPVVLPDGVSIPDFPGEEGTSFPPDGSVWCYTSSDCKHAVSDGWGTWTECAPGKGWDGKPPPQYPEATVCPLPSYAGTPPAFTMLTFKYDATAKDSCIGKTDHNDCHDPSGFGGANVGLVSSMWLNDTMVMLKRAYNAEAKDTCVYHEGAMATFCKASVGEYTGETDLGYVFSKEVPGTLPLKAYWDSIEEDSCASTNEESCAGVIEGTLGYVMDEVAADAWAECGAQVTEDKKYVVTLVTKMDAAPDASSPMTEKVPWIAMKQGVFTTSDGKMIQAGVSLIPADEEFHGIKFFQSFPSAPAVFVSNLDPVDVVRVKGETEAEFTASANAGFEAIESTGACAFRGQWAWAWKGDQDLHEQVRVDANEGNAVCSPDKNKQDCDATTGRWWESVHDGKDCWWDHHWPFHHCRDKYRNEERTQEGICVFNEWVIGKCRGKTPLDWGSCKKYVTSEDECKTHSECEWMTIAAEHTHPLVEVHWMAVEKTEAGVLGAYPFIAGDTTVGEETTVSFDAGFTQVPLVYGSASGEAKADVRVTSKDVGNFSMIVQGAEADEKISYFVYNGQSSVGTAFKAQGSVISYAYETAEFGACTPEEGSDKIGTKIRTVDCKRSDGETADDYYCAGHKPHETEACILEYFFVMSDFGGECLGPADGATAGHKVRLNARIEKCVGDKNEFKVESGQQGGFRLISVATGMCYCGKASMSAMYFLDCDEHAADYICDLEKVDESEDGTYMVKPVGLDCEPGGGGGDRLISAGHHKGRKGDGKIRTYCEDDLGKDMGGWSAKGDWSTRFALVKRGPLPISSYDFNVEPDGGKHWYKDMTGEMLTDGERLKGDFPTKKEDQKGVGWLSEVAIDFHLDTPGPIQTVAVGFNFHKGLIKWHVKKPKKVQVQCSSDGTAFGNAKSIQGSDIDVKPAKYYNDKDGGRAVLSFQVADICGDDTTDFRVTVTPQAVSTEKKSGKAVVDEVRAFAPFSLA